MRNDEEMRRNISSTRVMENNEELEKNGYE